MLDKDVRMLMKVVPSRKSAGVSEDDADLRSSVVWRRRGGAEQGFLYVVGRTYARYPGCAAWVLSNTKDDSGDWFLASDFEPYIEPELKPEEV